MDRCLCLFRLLCDEGYTMVTSRTLNEAHLTFTSLPGGLLESSITELTKIAISFCFSFPVGGIASVASELSFHLGGWGPQTRCRNSGVADTS